MSKVVKFDAKNMLGKDFEVIDSFKNVKKVNAGVRGIFEAIDEYETKQTKAHKPVTMMDYQDIVASRVIENTGALLGLSKEDTAKLEDMSYSDVFKFYSTVANDFLDMDIPDPSAIKSVIQGGSETEKKDPKSSEGK